RSRRRRVAVGAKTVPARLQAAAQLLKVVDLAVEDYLNRATLVAQRRTPPTGGARCGPARRGRWRGRQRTRDHRAGPDVALFTDVGQHDGAVADPRVAANGHARPGAGPLMDGHIESRDAMLGS